MLLVAVGEELLAESLYPPYDIPCLPVVHRGAYIVDNPSELAVVLLQTLYPFVYSLMLYLLVCKLDTQVGSEVELTGEIAQDRLEETVDCLHAEE